MEKIFIESSDNMNPIAFHIFGFEIRWYGLLISSAILLGLFISSKRCPMYKVNFDNLVDIFLVSLPSAIIGARLYYVIFNWSYYYNNPLRIINIREGGLAIHGGIIGALLAGYIMSKIKKINFTKILDITAPSFILGQSIGRWGNFFNSEAHGGIVTKDYISKFPKFIQKGMYINNNYYHPTFLYESIWNFIIFLLLLYLTKKDLKSGSLFYIYLLLYSVGRFFIEGLRTDSLMLGSIRVAQLISLLLIILCLILILKPRSKNIFSD